MHRTVKFDLLVGQESVDYTKVARREHLKPVEINLRIMEDVVKQTRALLHLLAGLGAFSSRRQAWHCTATAMPFPLPGIAWYPLSPEPIL